MTTILNTSPTHAISHNWLPDRRFTATVHASAAARRTSPVLSPQELRRIVSQMVD